MLFEGFGARDVTTPRGTIHAMVAGDGPPLLLLHGYPETHLMWHAVARALAERFTVVAADLPGYGDSFRPPVDEDHAAHSKRALAGDMVAAMGESGTDRSPSPATTAAGASPTAWRSTTPMPSRRSRCSTSSPPGRSGRRRTTASRSAIGTGRSSPSPRRCPNG